MSSKPERRPHRPVTPGAIFLAATLLGGLPPGVTAAPLPPLPTACGEWLILDRVPPLDYRRKDSRLKTVDDYHFGPSVEALVRPMQLGMTFGSDLDYTLIAYPNHHRALATLTRLGQRERTDQPKGSRFTIDCYFTRAVTLAPDDTVARMLFAQYLRQRGRRNDAMGHLKLVTEQAGDNGLTHYNVGLLLMELEAFPEAARQAQRAAELGFARRDLADELRKRGQWPAEAAPADSAKPAASKTGPKAPE